MVKACGTDIGGVEDIDFIFTEGDCFVLAWELHPARWIHVDH